MNVDYAKQAVVVEMEHGSFVFTPAPCDLRKTYGGELITPVEMKEPKVRVHGVFPLKGVVGNIHANGEASLRHYGKDHRVWIGNSSTLTFTRDSGAILPADGKRWKAAWMEVQDALKAFQVQVEDWEKRCMCLSVSSEIESLYMTSDDLHKEMERIDGIAHDLCVYRQAIMRASDQ